MTTDWLGTWYNPKEFPYGKRLQYILGYLKTKYISSNDRASQFTLKGLREFSKADMNYWRVVKEKKIR